MGTTPLLTRIRERRDRRIGPVAPLPRPITERMSPFARRLALKQLAPTDRSQFLHDGCGPDGRSA